MDVSTTVGNVGLAAAFFAGLSMFSLVVTSRETREKAGKLRSTLSCKRLSPSQLAGLALRRNMVSDEVIRRAGQQDADEELDEPRRYPTADLVTNCFSRAHNASDLNLTKALPGLLTSITDGFSGSASQRKYDIALAMAYHALPTSPPDLWSNSSAHSGSHDSSENNDSSVSQRTFTTLIAPDELLRQFELLELTESVRAREGS